MKEKVLALIFTLGNVFVGKRGDGIFFGWLVSSVPDDPDKSSTWSWVFPYLNWDVKVGLAFQFPLLGLMRVYVHKETGKLRTFFKGFTPQRIKILDDEVTVKINDFLTVTVYYFPASGDLTATIERGDAKTTGAKIHFVYSSDPSLVSP